MLTSEALITDVDVILDGEGPLALHKVLFVHLFVEGIIGGRRGVVSVAQPVEHGGVGKQTVIVYTQQLSAELLLVVRHLPNTHGNLGFRTSNI